MKWLAPGAMHEFKSAATKGFPGGVSANALITIHREGRRLP